MHKKTSISITLLLFFCFVVFNGEAQTTIHPKQIDYGLRGILYKEENSFSTRLHTNGIALGLNFGKIRTYYLTRYYHVDLGILKHPKEYRQPVNFQSGNILIKSSTAFAYGKQNNFLVLRGGIGEKRYFSEKAKRKGVAVGVSYEVGPSIGILKPYYLNLNRVEPGGVNDFISTEKYSKENEDVFLDVTQIYGSASFFKGIDEIKLVPGFHIKGGAHFSVGAFDKFVRAVEVGIMIDGFFQRVPIMILREDVKNQPVSTNIYLLVELGKRKEPC
jgi:hypothetical protein